MAMCCKGILVLGYNFGFITDFLSQSNGALLPYTTISAHDFVKFIVVAFVYLVYQ